MKRCLAFLAAAVIVVLAGCASAPFARVSLGKAEELEIGKYTRAECEAKFGPPNASEQRTAAAGKFETVLYLTMAEHWAKGCARALTLEFREGVLNGYAFQSSFEEDRSQFASTNISKIEWGISGKQRTLELLGKPQGKFQIPTTVFAAQGRRGGLDREVWVYYDLQGVPLLKPHTGKPIFLGTTCQITFDKFDVVTDVASQNLRGIE